MNQSDSKYPYREAVLSDAKGDVSKIWYVNYYVWSEKKATLVRKRGVFDQPTSQERYEAAAEFIELINQALASGAVTDAIEKVENKITASSTVSKVCSYFTALKSNTVDPNTLRGYEKDIRGFLAWADTALGPGGKKNISEMPISKFSISEVFAFSDHLDTKTWSKTGKDGQEVTKVGLAKKTYSNYISTMRTMWTLLVDRKILTENPWLQVNKRKGTSNQHIPYKPEQVRKYKKVCIDDLGDHQMWLFVNFIYYCFMRPRAEAQQLQIKHIHKKTIVIPGDIAKNNQTDHVRIPKGLERLIQEYGLRKYPPGFYVFSADQQPGLEPVGINYFYERNRKVLDRARLNDQEYDLYGWKHTGNIALYQATKDIKLIQIQNRHKDINTTDIYLRSLGLFLEDDAFDRFPDPESDI